ncbi:DUF167 domain-containing protein [Hymenobacter weizhouensis]|uniref:DUF167 domain-containing protein n=1 Tax=Hymenobacter sp. YIM 151500-1 TaxID=2987689 RepID=UPI0022267CE2|nr:hypothetical protein [Hymenobacter sp. YIM 151500-1]UYZ61479.1 hypothetical protein OIS53_10710 [Hymenobacter sp. YIM 151500-1]
MRPKAPTQNGPASAGLVAYLAEVFGVAKPDVQLLAGHMAPFKKGGIRGHAEQVKS